MIIYSKDICFFCKTKLVNKKCPVAKCYDKYEYHTYDGGLIDFYLGKYIIEILNNNDIKIFTHPIARLEAELPCMVALRTQKEVEKLIKRYKKLQAFK